MPMLRFVCAECGHKFEELVAASKIEQQRCPKCGGQTQRAYEGKCSFGAIGASKEKVCPSTGRSCGCAGSCPHHG